MHIILIMVVVDATLLEDIGRNTLACLAENIANEGDIILWMDERSVHTLSVVHNLEDENCRENENGKMEEEKIENVGRARERGNTGFYMKSYL